MRKTFKPVTNRERMIMYFPNNSQVRRDANFALAAMGLIEGQARIRENRKARRPVYDVLFKGPTDRRGRVVYSVVLF